MMILQSWFEGQPDVPQSAEIRSAMKMVSPRQSRHISGLFLTNVDWDTIPFEAGEAISGDPTEFGREATRFVQNGGRVNVTVTDGIIPPPGGRVRILTAVVDESRPWEDMVMAAGPNTMRFEVIFRVGAQYPPLSDIMPTLKQVVLVNFGSTAESSDGAMAWGRKQKLVPPTTRAVFSVSKHYSDLNQYLGTKYMSVVTLKHCSYDGLRCVPYVWFNGLKRGARLFLFDDAWSEYCWFAFSTE